jgi:biopolymer transport protein ExbB
MKKGMILFSVLGMMALALTAGTLFAQEDGAKEAGELVAAESGEAVAAPAPSGSGSQFIAVVFKSGTMSFILWLAIFAAGGAGVYFATDCAITVRPTRILPQKLIDNVTQAMVEGDVLKALKACDEEPGSLANVLSAGFSHVEEGFDVIQDAISTAADLETEKLMQKLTWLSVCANLSPMLGLLGTVQGMIMAFATLASGAPDIGMLALTIAQALYTTAAGLVIAIPCVGTYYYFRNTANRIVLRMEALTMEMIKDLRHVEVVED